MDDGKKKKSSYMAWGLGAFFTILSVLAVYTIWGILSEEAPGKKNNVATISLVKPPPPPPPIKEKPPEPQQIQPKKEEFIAESPADQPKGPDNQDDTPAGDKLGLDAEGAAGGDGFGLVGRKGGRSILSGGGGLGGGSSLLKTFAWYTQIVEGEVRRKVLKSLEEQGGIPNGRLQTVVELNMSETGVVTNFRIIGSSGNHRMDGAVQKALSFLRINEAPPQGMPRKMKIRVSSQG